MQRSSIEIFDFRGIICDIDGTDGRKSAFFKAFVHLKGIIPSAYDVDGTDDLKSAF